MDDGRRGRGRRLRGVARRGALGLHTLPHASRPCLLGALRTHAPASATRPSRFALIHHPFGDGIRLSLVRVSGRVDRQFSLWRRRGLIQYPDSAEVVSDARRDARDGARFRTFGFGFDSPGRISKRRTHALRQVWRRPLLRRALFVSVSFRFALPRRRVDQKVRLVALYITDPFLTQDSFGRVIRAKAEHIFNR